MSIEESGLFYKLTEKEFTMPFLKVSHIMVSNPDGIGDTLLGFRATVDHALLDTLKLKLPEIKGGQNGAQP